MQDRELYRQILGIEAPWWVERVELKPDEGEVHVYLEHRPTANWQCPECGAGCQVIRPSRGKTMATSGHLPVSDHSACPTTTDELRRAWSARGEIAVGGAREPLYRAAGTASDRLAANREPKSGG